MATGPLTPLLGHLRRITLVTTVPDTELLAHFAAVHDEAAFTALVRRHGPMVHGVCRRVLGDWHAAEDAFQATFLVLARKAGTLTRPEALGPWLHGVAYRTAVKARAEQARRRLHEKRAIPTQVVGPADDPIWRDLRQVLDVEVNGLPSRYRTPVILSYLEGKTNAEVARLLGCSRGTVATLLARARTILRRRLTRRGLTLSVGLTAALASVARPAGVSAGAEASTARAAILFAAGQTQVVGALPSRVVCLAEGVAKAMQMNRFKLGAVIFLLALLGGAGAALIASRAEAEGPETATTRSVGGPRLPTRDTKPLSAATRSTPQTPLGEVWFPCRPEEYLALFDRVLDVTDDYFEVSYANRYEGRIETTPRLLRRPETNDPSATRRLRQRASVQITSVDAGGFSVQVMIFREVERKRQPAPSAPADSADPVPAEPPALKTRHWEPLGHDTDLEQVILRRLAQTLGADIIPGEGRFDHEEPVSRYGSVSGIALGGPPSQSHYLCPRASQRTAPSGLAGQGPGAHSAGVARGGLRLLRGCPRRGTRRPAAERNSRGGIGRDSGGAAGGPLSGAGNSRFSRNR